MKKFSFVPFTFFKTLCQHLSITMTLLLLMASIHSNAQCPPGVECNFLTPKGTVTSANGAEISAFHPASSRVYTVAGSIIEFHNMNNAGVPTFGGTLPVGFSLPEGQTALPNSVAVYDNLLAASYTVVITEGSPAGIVHLNGRVTFYDATTGAVLNNVTVGSLPDMVVFTQDGQKLLTANEGEPSSYGRPTSVDPEGSISIVDLSSGVGSATVQTANFQTYVGQEANLRTMGVRIYGPNANAAQDFEPEYIAISPDGTKAWVTLQENNAFAIVDIATATVTQIFPLGLKDHSKPKVLGLETFQFSTMPSIGTTSGGQVMNLGGFSGLAFEGYAPNGNLKFVTHTDRGPNGEPTGQIRPFALPDFAPEIVRFEVNRTSGQVTLTQRLPLKKSNGQLLTGLPNINLIGGTESTPYHDESGVNLFNIPTGIDTFGADVEGVVVAEDGTFWMVDEYRIALYHFNTSGELIKRYVPEGTAAAAGATHGAYGDEKLPAVLSQRRQNRGFEGVAYQDGKLYLFVQSPLRNPTTTSNGTLNGWKYTRVIEFNPASETTTAQYVYVMDNAAPTSGTDSRADKIGDAVAIGNGEFLVLERDDDAIDSDPMTDIQKKIYRFSLAGATNINGLPNVIGGKTVEQMTLAELATNSIAPITKYLYVDLATNYNMTEKVEGLTLVDCNTIAVINDNDFGVGGLSFNAITGTFNGYPNPNAEAPLLGLISLKNMSLDANDRDVNGTSGGGGKIAIRHWPLMGMYQPDAIANFTVNGQAYYITANEGDARDWIGYAEEARVGDGAYTLDTDVFPNATTLKQNLNLGRMTVTKATGNTDADPQYEQMHVLSGRSFSIWNANGQLVFDSGNELEQITASLSPASFNSDGTSASFDGRSDNKGPEIEAVTVGVMGDVPYAFVGSERTGDIFVYDLTNPAQPVFKQYINMPGDLGVEGLAFVSGESSPTGRPLLISSAEVSKTVSIFEVNAPVCSIIAIPGNDTYTGGIPTNLYRGYGPRFVTLSVAPQSPSGGPYTYAWSGDGDLSSYNTPNPRFAPTEAGTYEFTVTVTSACGIKSICSITICVMDIRVPGKPNKVYLCHNNQTLIVSVGAVPTHLLDHPEDRLGKCSEEPCGGEIQERADDLWIAEEEIISDFEVLTYPNPTANAFTLQVVSTSEEIVTIQVSDVQGRLMYKTSGQQAMYHFGQEFVSGMYVVVVTQGDRRQMIRLVKQ
jgi:hypothetical protein